MSEITNDLTLPYGSPLRAPSFPDHPKQSPSRTVETPPVEVFVNGTRFFYLYVPYSEYGQTRTTSAIRWTVNGVQFEFMNRTQSRVKLTITPPTGPVVFASWSPGWTSARNQEFHDLPESIKAHLRESVEMLRADAKVEYQRREDIQRRAVEDAAAMRAETLGNVANLLASVNDRV